MMPSRKNLTELYVSGAKFLNGHSKAHGSGKSFFPIARRVAANPSGLGYTGMSVIDSAVKVIQVGTEDGGEVAGVLDRGPALGMSALSRPRRLESGIDERDGRGRRVRRLHRGKREREEGRERSDAHGRMNVVAAPAGVSRRR